MSGTSGTAMTQPAGLFVPPPPPGATRKPAKAPDKMPAHVKRKLVAAGHIDPDTGATRRTRATTCEECRAPIMRGFDADFGWQSRDVDPAALTVAGEISALMAGVPTFNLSWNGAHGYRLDIRDQWVIAGQPAGTGKVDVVALHIHHNPPFGCGPSVLCDKTPAVNHGDTPPY